MNLITLPNGLRIFLDKKDDLRSATVGVWTGAGARNETAEKSGISHFIEHIVFKGSEKRTGFEIAEGMDEIGAHVNAYTTKEYTFFYTKALGYQILKASDILFDMIRNPRLDEKDIETEKGVVLEEINMCEDDPGDVVYEVNESSLFKGTPLEMQILGQRETVSALTKEDIVAYMKDNYCADKTVIGISGNFDEEAMLQKVGEYFSDMPHKSKDDGYFSVPFNKDMALKTMQTEQTHLMMCFNGIGIKHEDLYPLQVCMFILGTGTSSMLYQKIREELGLCYSIDSWLGRYRGGGYIAVSVSLSPDSEEKAINEIAGIVGAFPEKVTQRQVDIAKEKLISSLIMSREQPQSKFASIGYNLLMLSEVIEDDDIINSIKAITLDDVVAVSRKYLRLDEMAFSAVGKVKTKKEYESILKSAIKK